MSTSTLTPSTETGALAPASMTAANTEEVEAFGAAGPILAGIFVLWGLTMAAAAFAVS